MKIWYWFSGSKVKSELGWTNGLTCLKIVVLWSDSFLYDRAAQPNG